MGRRENHFELVYDWTRFTFGVQWQLDKGPELFRLEIAVLIPIISLSILVGPREKEPDDDAEAKLVYDMATDTDYKLSAREMYSSRSA